MQMGILGLPGSGRRTVFEALKGDHPSTKRGGNLLCTVKVPDPRVDRLSAMYQPKKTTHAQVEYVLANPDQARDGDAEALIRDLRNCDALIHVVRNFAAAGPPSPRADLQKLSSEMVFADFAVLQKRAERLEADQKRGKKPDPEEVDVIRECLALLEKDQPLRLRPDLAGSPLLRSFGLVSAKPVLHLINNDDEDEAMPDLGPGVDPATALVIRGKLEQELAGMSPEEAAEFLKDFGIESRALDRVIRSSYEMLGLASFFTVGEDEVKAWTIRRDTAAVDAAEEIHSDIKKGFIRAEVVSYDDLMAAGSHNEAKKVGKVRLEGKTYLVQDGDIINFRFNV